MNIINSISVCFRKYAVFGGRANPAEFWGFYFFSFMIGLISGYLDETGYVAFTILMVTLLPSLSAGARRLHDTNKSGWWQLLYFLPIVGYFILLYMWSKKGNDSENAYGASEANE